MNIPFKILKAQYYRTNDADEAFLAFQKGLITRGECLAIIRLAIAWCEFINQFYGTEIHDPSNP